MRKEFEFFIDSLIRTFGDGWFVLIMYAVGSFILGSVFYLLYLLFIYLIS